MSEKFSEELISAYFDGEVTAEERAQVEALLQSDPAARRALEEIRSLSGLVRQMPAPPAPQELSAAVLQNIERQMLLGPPAAQTAPARSASPGAGRLPWIYGGGALAAAAVLFVAVSLLSNRGDDGAEIANLDHTIPVAAPAAGESFGVSTADHDFSAAGEPARVASRSDRGAASPADVTEGNRPARTLAVPAAPAAPSVVAESAPTASTLNGRSRLVFGTEVRDAEIGQVVQALEHQEGRVTVVTLTVVDRMEGLRGFQSLLARNSISPEMVSVDNGAAVRDEAGAQSDASESAGDLVCLYVEAPSERLSAVLGELNRVERSNRALPANSMEQYQELLVNNSVAIKQLEPHLAGRSGANLEPQFGDGDEASFAKGRKSAPSAEKADDAAVVKKEGKDAADKESKPAKEPALAGLDQKKEGDALGEKLAAVRRGAGGVEHNLGRQVQVNLPELLLRQVAEKPSGKRDEVEGLVPADSPVVAQRPDDQRSRKVIAQPEEAAAERKQLEAPVQVLFVFIDGKSSASPSTPQPNAPPVKVKVRNNRDDAPPRNDDGAAS